MVAGDTRQRTLAVLLRALLSLGRSGALRASGNTGPVVRRLLAVGGLAAVGWLLGHAGQAHADTVPGPVPHIVTGALDAGPDVRHPARPATAMAAAVSTPVSESAGGAIQAVDELNTTAVLPTRTPEHLTVPAGLGRTQGASWVKRPMGTAASIGTGATVNTAKAGTSAKAAPAAPAARSGAPKKTSRGERATSHAARSHPLPAPGLPRPENRQAGITSGATVAGHLLKAGSLHRPAPLVFAPITGAAAPAVHTAADEPSFAPD